MVKPAKYADRLGKIREIIGGLLRDGITLDPEVPSEFSKPLSSFYVDFGFFFKVDQPATNPEVKSLPDIEADLSSSGEMSEELDPDEIGIGGMA